MEPTGSGTGSLEPNSFAHQICRGAAGLKVQTGSARRSALGARRSALGARRSALGARRSALGARRSALGVICATRLADVKVVDLKAQVRLLCREGYDKLTVSLSRAKARQRILTGGAALGVPLGADPPGPGPLLLALAGAAALALRVLHRLALGCLPDILQDIRCYTLCDLRRRFVHRLPRQMCIARGGLDLAVNEEFADHRKRLAQRERPGRIQMTQVMKAHAVQLRPRSHHQCRACACPGSPTDCRAPAPAPPEA